ncbi:hypothetical protein [Klebsiella phage phiKp_32]|nr:hypothetical protein [Klebsiella phage phiKp_32]
MNEESKIAIVSHGEVVEFDPNSADHRKILESANRKLITNELYQRDLKRFKELVLFYQSAVSKETVDDKIEEFLRATGIRLDYSDLAIFNYGYPDIDGYFEALYNRAMGIESADENPIVGLKEKSLDPQHSSTNAGGGLLYDILLRKFNRFMQNVTADLLLLVDVKSLTRQCRIETNILRKIEGFNKETNLELDRVGIGRSIDENSQTEYFNVLFVDLIKRSEEFRIQTIPLSEKIRFYQSDCGEIRIGGSDKPSTIILSLLVTDKEGRVCSRNTGELLPGDKPLSCFICNDSADKKESRNEQPTGRLRTPSRYWYDRFGHPHLLESGKPMHVNFIKCEPGYGKYLDLSVNKGPIPSPDPRDESVRGKDTVIQNGISITTGKVNMHALEAACRTMAENMKAMHRKPVSDEFRDKLYEALAAFYHRHHSLGNASREFLYGDVICIERFKREFGIVFSDKDVDAFLNGVMPIPELLSKYVRELRPGEKKITTYSQYALALNTITSLLCLFPSNVRTREDIERAKALHVQFNIRFDIDMSEEDFLAIIYRHGAPRHFLKKHATTEATKGE